MNTGYASFGGKNVDDNDGNAYGGAANCWAEKPAPMHKEAAEPTTAVSPPNAERTMAGQAAPLWPNGMGITDMPVGSEAESMCCPPWTCCAWNVWYTDAHRSSVDPRPQQLEFACCNCNRVPGATCCGWDFQGDVMGVPLQMAASEPECCSCTRTIQLREQGRYVGEVRMYEQCACSQVVMAEAFDADGVSKFQRIDNPCHPLDHFSGDVCDWNEQNWPIKQSGNPHGQPIAYLTYRRNCSECRPKWWGIREWPTGVTREDQLLLAALVHARYWRTRIQEQQQSNGAS